MVESEKQEMKFIEGEGIDFDEKNVTVEYEDIIEFELSENISLMYSKTNKSYYIWGIDDSTYDEFTYELDESFDGINVDGIYISKEEYLDFKTLIENIA